MLRVPLNNCFTLSSRSPVILLFMSDNCGCSEAITSSKSYSSLHVKGCCGGGKLCNVPWMRFWTDNAWGVYLYAVTVAQLQEKQMLAGPFTTTHDQMKYVNWKRYSSWCTQHSMRFGCGLTLQPYWRSVISGPANATELGSRSSMQRSSIIEYFANVGCRMSHVFNDVEINA